MPDYNTRHVALQVVDSVNTKNLKPIQARKIEEHYIDTRTGERVDGLTDRKFPWRARKRKTFRLGDIYKRLHERQCAAEGVSPAGYTSRYLEAAQKSYSCGTWLEYIADLPLYTVCGDDMTRRRLLHFNACHGRLCPICTARRANRMAGRLDDIVERVVKKHDDVQFLFLTLTVRNVPGDKLGDAITLLFKAWSKLTRRRAFARAVKGFFRALEITYNKAADTYHPHIHAILAVENAYFDPASGLYLTHADFVQMWRESLKVNYDPSVRISATYSKNAKLDEDGKPIRDMGGLGAVSEAAKYATKDAEYLDFRMDIDKAADVVAVYTAALYKRRLTALGGWLLEAAQGTDLEDDGDLVNDGDENKSGLTLQTAPLLENWGWHTAVKNHVLDSRLPNPDYDPELVMRLAEEAEMAE